MEQTLRIPFPFESCMSSVACDMEEVSSESLRKMHDKEEITPEASWTAVTKGKGKEVWRLEPEGETETPEVTVWWNEAEGVSVNLEGESHQGQTQVKILEGKEKRQVKRVRRLKSSKGK